ncbi:hypothetical protein ACEU07_15095 [Chromobacterium violaceum]|uniref:hypothetical protein n=1 Tax=Chromobacterium violaceum TaxID=536 RepID=UPI0035A5BD0F
MNLHGFHFLNIDYRRGFVIISGDLALMRAPAAQFLPDVFKNDKISKPVYTTGLASKHEPASVLRTSDALNASRCPMTDGTQCQRYHFLPAPPLHSCARAVPNT